MQNHSDAQLLCQYAGQRSEAAFGEIVARHAGLVYSAALRQLESPDLARDVAQSVFTDLARKAPSLADKLSGDASLAGWLYRSTRFAARDRLRGDSVTPPSLAGDVAFAQEVDAMLTLDSALRLLARVDSFERRLAAVEAKRGG